MSYDDWDTSFQDMFDYMPGMADAEQYDPDFDRSYAEALFEEGFTHRASEYDAEGLDPSQVAAIRDEFFDYMGMDPSEFDWEEWREAMGYE